MTRTIAVVLTVIALLIPTLVAASGEPLKQVDSKFVCFITKKHFSSPQTAVSVEGKTYYSCCDMCKTKLMNEPASRLAKDPVSGKEIDMSKAVIGVDKAGNAYFFENAANLKQFKAPAK
jgi:YHS domain-containing protein